MILRDQRTLEAELVKVSKARDDAQAEVQRLQALVSLLAGNHVPASHIQRLLHSDSP